MLTAYCFNSSYNPNTLGNTNFPSLRLLEGGKFSPKEYAPVLIREFEQVRLKFFHWRMAATRHKRFRTITPSLFMHMEDLQRGGAQYTPCLVPADGIYLELPHPRGKQGFKLRRPNGGAFCFAGVYRSFFSKDGSEQYGFSILGHTHTQNIKGYSISMPIILDKKMEKIWLNPNISLEKKQALLNQLPHESFEVHSLRELVAA